VGGKGRGVFVDMTRHAPKPGSVERIKVPLGRNGGLGRRKSAGRGRENERYGLLLKRE
jgi:hypothetical protein